MYVQIQYETLHSSRGNILGRRQTCTIMSLIHVAAGTGVGRGGAPREVTAHP